MEKIEPGLKCKYQDSCKVFMDGDCKRIGWWKTVYFPCIVASIQSNIRNDDARPLYRPLQP